MKKLLSLVLLIGVLGFAGCETTQPTSDSSGWDHKTITISAVSPTDYNQQLQGWIRDGWTVESSSTMNQNGGGMTAKVVLKRPSQ